MKHLFDCRSQNSFLDPEPTLTPPDPEHAMAHSALPTSEISTGLNHLIPNDVKGNELGLIGMDNPIPLHKLFDFDSDGWTRLYDNQGRKHLAEELAVCELLGQDCQGHSSPRRSRGS